MALSRPYIWPTKRRYSGGGEAAEEREALGDYADLAFDFEAALAAKSMPRIWMLPAVGASRPVSILMVVDLPAPLGPRKPKNWPCIYAQIYVLDGYEIAEAAGKTLGGNG